MFSPQDLCRRLELIELSLCARELVRIAFRTLQIRVLSKVHGNGGKVKCVCVCFFIGTVLIHVVF